MLKLAVFFLTVLVGCYAGGQTECIDEAQYCMADLPLMTVDVSLKDTRCRVLIKSIECLEKAVNHGPCAGGEFEDMLKETIDEIKQARNEKCIVQNVLSKDNEILQCFEANDDSVIECLAESTAEILDALADQRDAEYYEGRLQCAVLTMSVKCLEKAVNHGPCAGGEFKDRLKETIYEIKVATNEKCIVQNVLSKDDEIQQCPEAKSDFIILCLAESAAEVWDDLADQRDAENYDDRLECTLYVRTASCLVERVNETCGAEAAVEAVKIVITIPDEVKEACEATGTYLLPPILDEARRKK